jgi:hypothetical protein
VFAVLAPACAEDEPFDDDDEAGWSDGTRTQTEASQEVWLGVESTRGVFAAYSGATWSPFSNLRQDGFRLRLIGAQSYYRYAGLRYNPAIADAQLVNFRGAASMVDVLTGWQWSAGQLTVKAFAGLRMSDHRIAPFDPETLVQGEARGAVGVLEAWYNLTDRLWTSLDVNVAQSHRAYSHKLRFGWRATSALSIGVEGQALGHIENRTLKAGAFVRFDDGVNEVVASGGSQMPDGVKSAPYATLQWLRRF